MDPFIGEIRMFGGNFAPAGWLFCDGSLLNISDNDTLFSLIGTTYGGDGQTTFALPDLRSRVPIHMGTLPGGTYTLGQSTGSESITLTTNNLPAHAHEYNYQPLASGSAGTQTSPANAYYAGSGRSAAYSPTDTIDTNMADISTVSGIQTGPAGGSQPISVIQPYQAVYYIISLYGIYPPQS